jgi:hypothetical protein
MTNRFRKVQRDGEVRLQDNSYGVDISKEEDTTRKRERLDKSVKIMVIWVVHNAV